CSPPPLKSGRDVDLMTLFEGHDRFLHADLLADRTAKRFDLALAVQRIDALDLDVEQFLDRLFDLRLGGGARDLEDHLVPLGGERRLLGNHGRANDVVVPRILWIHLNRASSASSAAFVSTSLCRRRMS